MMALLFFSLLVGMGGICILTALYQMGRGWILLIRVLCWRRVAINKVEARRSLPERRTDGLAVSSNGGRDVGRRT